MFKYEIYSYSVKIELQTIITIKWIAIKLRLTILKYELLQIDIAFWWGHKFLTFLFSYKSIDDKVAELATKWGWMNMVTTTPDDTVDSNQGNLSANE